MRGSDLTSEQFYLKSNSFILSGKINALELKREDIK
jgi:hypothetical protein